MAILQNNNSNTTLNDAFFQNVKRNYEITFGADPKSTKIVNLIKPKKLDKKRAPDNK